MGGELEIEDLTNIHRVDAFDLTPDGTPLYTAHRDGSFELFVGNQRITATDRDFRQPTWLEDRGTVLVLADEGGSEMYDLVEVNPETGDTTTRLDDEHMNDAPVQSPDASDVVGFLSSRGGGLGLYEIHLDSGDVGQLASPERPVPKFDWSPDGERLVYREGLYDRTRLRVTDDNGSQVLLDFDDSEEKLGMIPFTTGSNFWSEGGILFSSNQNDTADIGVVQPSGEYEWLITNDYDKTPGGWSPDGKRFAYFEARPGDNVVKVRDEDGSRPVLDAGYGLRVRWYPDGTPVALRLNYDSRGEIWHGGTAVITEGRAESSLVEPSVVHFDSFDGRSIPALLHEADSNRALVFAHGGPENRIMNVLCINTSTSLIKGTQSYHQMFAEAPAMDGRIGN